MFERVTPHPTPDKLNRGLNQMVLFKESPMAKHPRTEITLNDRFEITAEALAESLYLPGAGALAELQPFPKGTMSRGREIGTVANPVTLKEKLPNGKTYNKVVVLSIKGLGISYLPQVGSYQPYGSAMGVLGATEAAVDMGVSEVLSEAGANVGDFVALISVPRGAFLEHYKNPATGGEPGKAYAEHLIQHWKEDPEYIGRKFLDGIVRLTDPERMSSLTFTSPEHLIDSARWLQAELRANTKAEFDEYYELPKSLSEHLEYPLKFTAEEIHDPANQKIEQFARAQAHLLAYIVMRNYVIAIKNQIDTSFSPKDIGNLGKLHDFPLAFDRVIEVSQWKGKGLLDKRKEVKQVVDPTLPMTRGSFESLVIYEFFNRGEGSYLSEKIFLQMGKHLNQRYGLHENWQSMLDAMHEYGDRKKDGFRLSM